MKALSAILVIAILAASVSLTGAVGEKAKPRFDNVGLHRYSTAGPQWYSQGYELFQDSFPTIPVDVESWVRADMAADINEATNPVIRPGDSIVVSCSSPLGGGIDTVDGRPAVYLHVKASYIGIDEAKPDLVGAALAGSCARKGSYVTFPYVSDDGTWTTIQCHWCFSSAGGPAVEDRFMVDLNDELFTRGYEISYYFTAMDSAGVTTAYPPYARSGGPCFEWSTLPSLNSEVLFVDDFDGQGSWNGVADDYWRTVFDWVLPYPNNLVDRYDVNSPGLGVDNGLGSRAVFNQIIDYKVIIWDSGDLDWCTISDGVADKSNDVALLIEWMESHENNCGLWVCGDGIANELNNSELPLTYLFMSYWCGTDFYGDSYYEFSGDSIASPLLTGDADAGIFWESGVPDRFYLAGGSLPVNRFDVLLPTENGEVALTYPDVAEFEVDAAIASTQTNSMARTVRTLWFGFSFSYVRDDQMPTSLDRFYGHDQMEDPPDRFLIAEDVFSWMDIDINIVIGHDETPKAYRLAQNFPNPFNPTTTIKYDMKAKGLVRIRVYNVAGQLVRTLVDEVKGAGSHTIGWNGKNDRDGAVASGIYFCKMEAGGFRATKKLVLLR